MNTPKYVISVEGRTLFMWSLEAFPPSVAVSRFADGQKVYLVFSNDERWYTLPLNLFFCKYGSYVTDTWTSLLSKWTLASIAVGGSSDLYSYVGDNPEYNLPIPRFAYVRSTVGNNTVTCRQEYVEGDNKLHRYCTPKVCGCDHKGSIRVFYGGIGSTHPITRPFWIYHKDIVFSSTLVDLAPVNFTNCIPICGGIAYYPELSTDGLHAREAGYSLWPTYRRNLNQYLIDFTPVGGMTPILLSACAITVENSWVRIVLPEPTNVTGKSLLLSLYGRLFMLGNKVLRVGQKTITFPLSFIRSLGFGLNHRRTTERTARGTMAIAEPIDTPAILRNLTTQYYNYFIVVNTRGLYEVALDETMRLTDSFRRFPLGARGLVQNVTTGQFQDYVLMDNNNDTVVNVQAERPLLVPKGQLHDHHMQRAGFLHSRCGGSDMFTNMHASPWKMVEWITTEELVNAT